jgi:hypothetical protein
VTGAARRDAWLARELTVRSDRDEAPGAVAFLHRELALAPRVGVGGPARERLLDEDGAIVRVARRLQRAARRVVRPHDDVELISVAPRLEAITHADHPRVDAGRCRRGQRSDRVARLRGCLLRAWRRDADQGRGFATARDGRERPGDAQK